MKNYHGEETQFEADMLTLALKHNLSCFVIAYLTDDGVMRLRTAATDPASQAGIAIVGDAVEKALDECKERSVAAVAAVHLGRN